MNNWVKMRSPPSHYSILRFLFPPLCEFTHGHGYLEGRDMQAQIQPPMGELAVLSDEPTPRQLGEDFLYFEDGTVSPMMYN